MMSDEPTLNRTDDQTNDTPEPDWEALWRRSEVTRRRSRRGFFLAVLAAVLGFGALMGVLAFGIAFRGVPASQDEITHTQAQLKCIAVYQSDFMAEVGEFANSAPAPNNQRAAIQKNIDSISNRLRHLDENC